MDETKREIRSIECQLAIREAAPDAQSESRTITGTAIVFNRESQELDDWGERFVEIIKPEAVTMEFLNTQDIKLNLLHQRDMTVARCNKGDLNASLRFFVDEEGMHFEADMPKCDLGDRALALVRSGVYSGCSFEFAPKDYEKVVDGDKVTIVHRAFKYLNAITIGMDPAYRQTTVNVRELLGKKSEEELKRDQEEREQAEREQRAIAAYERRKRELELAQFNIR